MEKEEMFQAFFEGCENIGGTLAKKTDGLISCKVNDVEIGLYAPKDMNFVRVYIVTKKEAMVFSSIRPQWFTVGRYAKLGWKVISK